MARVGVTLPYAAVEDVHPLHFCCVFVKENLGWNATTRSVEDIHYARVKYWVGRMECYRPVGQRHTSAWA
jgi:hypothetical protein